MNRLGSFMAEVEMQEPEINESNFSQYFRDVRTSNPSKDEVMAQYSAVAEFVDGNEKRQIIALLTKTDSKMEATAQVMRKLLFASEIDAYRVPRIMAEDLMSGMTEDEVATKPYKYTLEMFFYTNPENIPKEDPHWSSISLLNVDELAGKTLNRVESRILEDGGAEGSDDTDSPEGFEHGSPAAGGDARRVEASEAE